MATGTGAAIGAGEGRDRRVRHYSSGMPALVAGIYTLLGRKTKDVDGRDVVREDGAARLMPGHDARCESLQCAIDCWPKSLRRRFAAKKFQDQKHFDFRCLRGCCESIRRSRLTFISVTTNCATVSLNKGAF
jgi:hypothetical protein